MKFFTILGLLAGLRSIEAQVTVCRATYGSQVTGSPGSGRSFLIELIPEPGTQSKLRARSLYDYRAGAPYGYQPGVAYPYLLGNGATAPNSHNATIFTDRSGQLFAEGKHYSTSSGETSAVFADSSDNGAINGIFGITDDFLFWDNDAFDGQTAIFCLDGPHLLLAIFKGPVPTGCKIVHLRVVTVPSNSGIGGQSSMSPTETTAANNTIPMSTGGPSSSSGSPSFSGNSSLISSTGGTGTHPTPTTFSSNSSSAISSSSYPLNNSTTARSSGASSYPPVTTSSASSSGSSSYSLNSTTSASSSPSSSYPTYNSTTARSTGASSYPPITSSSASSTASPSYPMSNSTTARSSGASSYPISSGTGASYSATNTSTSTSASSTNPSTVQLTSPTPIVGDLNSAPEDVDDGGYEVQLPFAIQIYNESATQVFVTTNGILSFENTYEYDNEALYSDSIPGFSACPFWDDTYVYQGEPQGIFYQIDGSTVTFEYALSRYDDATQYYHYQVIYDSNVPGVFKYKYFQVTDDGESATVGIQGADPTALQYSYNQTIVTPNLLLTVDTVNNDITQGTF